MKEKPNNAATDSNIVDLRKLDSPINSLELIKSIVSSAQNVEKDPFYIVDLEDICNKHINWITRLPRVEPHYAVKCNTDSMLLKLLAFLGAGFDCASKNEIQRVLDMGVAPHRIIFANPCKQASNIKYACKMGVEYMTFDNENELYKIKEHHPEAKCVLRIITNDEDAVCRFSMKFGADMETSLKLIETCVQLGIDLVGVSFHVGSGQMSPKAFVEAIRNARQLFDYARENYGLKFHLLDLGGGYPGSAESGDFFSMIAREINTALETYFPAELFAQINGTSDEHKLKIIAEPGRYYACSAFSLCVSVIAKRVMNQSAAQQKTDKDTYSAESQSSAHAAAVTSYMCSTPAQLTAEHVSKTLDTGKSMMYYVNDGVYASFNCLFYDHAECLPVLVNDEHHSIGSDGGKLYKSSIWGPTCDGLDVVVKECVLPELKTEEYMMFKNMGAYTLSGAVAFNGIPLARCIYVASNSSWDTIKDAFEDTICVDSSTLPPAASNSGMSASACTPTTSCGAASAGVSSLPSTAAKMSNTSCAAMAHLHARSISLQLDDLHLNSNGGVSNNSDSCAGSDEEVDLSKDGHLIGEVVAEAKEDLDVDCAITC